MAEIRVKETGTIKLFESDNTSSVTIASPASLGGDRTVTLPDASVTLASGTMLATDGDGSSLTGLTPGITEADQWRITSAFQNTAQPIASNWERNDTEFEKIGTGMTESSGVFTFPSTGKWSIRMSSSLYIDNAAERSAGADLELSVNAGGAWSTIVAKSSSMYDSGTNTSANVFGEAIVDVTNTTNYLIRMSAIVVNSVTWTTGSTTRQNTGMTFLKLGDT